MSAVFLTGAFSTVFSISLAVSEEHLRRIFVLTRLFFLSVRGNKNKPLSLGFFPVLPCFSDESVACVNGFLTRALWPEAFEGSCAEGGLEFQRQGISRKLSVGQVQSYQEHTRTVCVCCVAPV